MAKIYWRQGWAHARATVHGVEHRQALGTRSAREAESRFQAWLAELTTETKRGGAKVETTWSKAVGVYAERHLPTLERSSQQRYLVSLINIGKHFTDDTPLRDIGQAQIMGYIDARRREGVTDATIRRDLACMSSVYTIAADYELVDTNPVLPLMRRLKRQKRLVESDPRQRYLSHDDEEAILLAAIRSAANPDAIRRDEKAMIAAAIALYVDTGLRGQELLSARWSWIDLARNEITVPASETKAGRARTVPLLPRARRIIEMLPRHDTSTRLLWRCNDGRAFADLNKTFQRIAADAGVGDVHIHDLRRTCGCRLLQDHRLQMAEVSRWLGHASVVMTERAYAFLRTEDLHDAIGGRARENAARERLAGMFSGDSVTALDGIEPAPSTRLIAVEAKTTLT